MMLLLAMNLAPIILFVYNRPNHTKKTVEALLLNHLAHDSELYIFADGAKIADDPNVVTVRNYIAKISGFKKVIIEESMINKGLANSVITGVTKIINQYGRVIVLEDDIITQPYFLTFMNEALNFYDKSTSIMSIGGFTHLIEFPSTYHDEIFLSYRTCSWGWATWQTKWALADWDMSDYSSFKKDKRAQKNFNKRGADVTSMLDMQMNNQIDSWAIRWDYAHFKNHQLVIRPINSLVSNCGTDGSGVHYKGDAIEVAHTELKNSKVALNSSPKVNTKIIKNYYKVFGSPTRSFLYRVAKKILIKLPKKVLSKVIKMIQSFKLQN